LSEIFIENNKFFREFPIKNFAINLSKFLFILSTKQPKQVGQKMKTKTNRKLVQKIFSAIAICSVASVGYATDYTSRVQANGTTVTLQNGDTVTTTGAGSSNYALGASNGGIITVQNPATDSIIVNSDIRGAYISGAGTSLNLGTGSIVNITTGPKSNSEVSGINAASGTNVTANALTINLPKSAMSSLGSSAMYGMKIDDATVNVGSNTTINVNGYDTTGITAGIRVTNGATFTAVDKFTVDSLGAQSRGLQIGLSGSVNIGTNASISADHIGVNLYTKGFVTATDATILSRNGHAIGTATGGSGIFNNSNIIGYTAGISVQTNSTTLGYSGDTSNVIINGGNVYATNGAAIMSTGTNIDGSEGINSRVEISGGAKISSATGVLYNDAANFSSVTSNVDIIISGAGTEAEGTFNGTSSLANSTLTVDSATWKSTGSSNMDNLILDNANLEFDMTSISDSITTGNLTLEGHSEALIGFTNDFLEEIIAAGGSMNDIDASIVTSFLDGFGDITYIYKTSNDEGSTWDITDHGDGTFDISNINIIPEPSTYALIFGLLALGFATYRRRK